MKLIVPLLLAGLVGAVLPAAQTPPAESGPWVVPARAAARKNPIAANAMVPELPIAEPPPGGDAYITGRMWQWYPALRLRVGETYRLHLSALDLQHGFSLQPLNMNFQVLPGYDHVLTITPTSKGEFTIVCNEFCGIGHHAMTGKIFVE